MAVYEEAVAEGMQHYGCEGAHTLRLFLNREGWEPTPVEQIPTDLASLFLDRGGREAIALAVMLGGPVPATRQVAPSLPLRFTQGFGSA